jgi:hypothetical protein
VDEFCYGQENEMADRRDDANTGWTAEMVRAVLTDPIYAGMGPYPALVGDDLWLDVNVRRIGEEGAEAVVESVLERFWEMFPDLQIPNGRSYTGEAKANPRAALRRLLTDLRELADGYDPHDG